MEPDGLLALERLERAVEKIRNQLLRATAALKSANIPYAVVGGNAVMAWVEQIDETAVRFTQDVDIAIRRADLDSAKQAMEKAGFVYRHVKSIDMFLDGPDAKARDAVRIIFAGEKVRSDDAVGVPQLADAASYKGYRVIKLESLVQMKLTSFRRKDQVHLQDMIEVVLVDATWPAKYPPALATRLQTLLDDPDG